MKSKYGAINWTVGKLINIILLVVVLVLVVYGITINGFGPLIDRVEVMYDDVLVMFGDMGIGGKGSEECSVWQVADRAGGPDFLTMLAVSDASVTVCTDGVCSISLGGAGEYRIKDGAFEKLSPRDDLIEPEGEDWKEWRALIKEDLGSAKFHQELYQKWKELLGRVEPGKSYPDFLESGSSKKFVLYGDGAGPGGDIVAIWQDNEWKVTKEENMLYFGSYTKSTRSDIEAITLFYKEVTKTRNDNVYWKILDSEEVYDKVDNKGLPIGAIALKEASLDELYAGIVMAEHGLPIGRDLLSSSPFWIRTEAKGSGSSAYGPLQLTVGLAKGYLEKKGMEPEWTDPEKIYLNKFIDQGCLFLLHGGGKIDQDQFGSDKCGDVYKKDEVIKDTKVYDSKYDYGGRGNLFSGRDKVMYKQVVEKMLYNIYNNNNQDIDKTLYEWRFGAGHIMTAAEKRGYDKYVERFYKVFPVNKKLDSDLEVDKLKSIFEGERADFLKELYPSSDDVGKLKISLDGKKIKAGSEEFDVGVDESVSPFVISFSVGGIEKYGMKYYPHGADKSDLFFGSGGMVSLDMLPFVLVEKKDTSWVEIGDESVYKLLKDDFDKVFQNSVIHDFLRKVCR